MNGEHFTKTIKNIINTCSFNFFLVQQDFSKKCTCTNHTTKQSDDSCKKCLGTGYKIKIKKCSGACNDELKGGATLSSKSSRILKNYFIDDKYEIYENNLIIDRNEIYYVYRVEKLKGVYNMDTHKEVTAILKTNDHNKVLDNFLDLINKRLSPEQKGEFGWLD